MKYIYEKTIELQSYILNFVENLKININYTPKSIEDV